MFLLNPEGTQGWNLYAYVANNPTTWVDPTGHVAAGAIPRAPRPETKVVAEGTAWNQCS
ncbi:MAG: hypothetical protein IT303_08470 [Dehalococcoidia bacterium]|nr:hypothetical protein [Dehalococcoidia bacterium]